MAKLRFRFSQYLTHITTIYTSAAATNSPPINPRLRFPLGAPMMWMILAAAQLVSSSGDVCIYDKGEIVFQEALPAAIGVDLRQRAPDLSPSGGPFQATDVGIVEHRQHDAPPEGRTVGHEHRLHGRVERIVAMRAAVARMLLQPLFQSAGGDEVPAQVGQADDRRHARIGPVAVAGRDLAL